METIIVVLHVIVAIAVVALVLLQQGKGADTGAAFGSGSSQTVFGGSGAGSFLTRATTIAATVFFATSLTLAIYAREATEGGAVNGSSPVSNPELLNDSAVDGDIPQVSEPGSGGEDLPTLPGGE